MFPPFGCFRAPFGHSYGARAWRQDPDSGLRRNDGLAATSAGSTLLSTADAFGRHVAGLVATKICWAAIGSISRTSVNPDSPSQLDICP